MLDLVVNTIAKSTTKVAGKDHENIGSSHIYSSGHIGIMPDGSSTTLQLSHFANVRFRQFVYIKPSAFRDLFTLSIISSTRAATAAVI